MEGITLWTPLWLSLMIGALAVAIALPVGALLAWLMHSRRSTRATVVESVIMLPLIFPPTVLGFYLLELFGRNGPFGRLTLWLFDTTIVFTPVAAVLAAAVVAVPIMYRALKIEFESVPGDVIGAARLEGAGELAIFYHIRLPLAARSLMAGITLSFLRALGEFGATLMIAGSIPGRTQTLSLAIWSAFSNGDYRTAHILAAALVALSLFLIAVLRLIEGRVHGPEA